MYFPSQLFEIKRRVTEKEKTVQMPINFYFHVAIISSYPFLLVKKEK